MSSSLMWQPVERDYDHVDEGNALKFFLRDHFEVSHVDMILSYKSLGWLKSAKSATSLKELKEAIDHVIELINQHDEVRIYEVY